MEKISLHPSGISAYFDCQYKWFRDNLYKPIRRVGYRANLGTGIHKAAELQYNESIKAGAYVSFKEEFEQAAIDTFRDCIKSDELCDKDEMNQSEVESIIVTATKEYGSNIQNINNDKLPLAVEQHYYLDINSSLIQGISGTLDIVGEDYIVDIKTMSKNKSVAGYIVQQGIYAFLRQSKGELVNTLFIDKILLNNKKKICTREDIFEQSYKQTSEIIDYVKFLLNVIISKVEEFSKTGNERIFIGNPNCWLCSKKYCPYFDECKYHL